MCHFSRPFLQSLTELRLVNQGYDGTSHRFGILRRTQQNILPINERRFENSPFGCDKRQPMCGSRCNRTSVLPHTVIE